MPGCRARRAHPRGSGNRGQGELLDDERLLLPDERLYARRGLPGQLALRSIGTTGYRRNLHLAHVPNALRHRRRLRARRALRRIVQNATRNEVTTGICTPGTCRTDADCGSGSFCISPLNVPSHSRNLDEEIATFNCQTSEDECFGPQSCPAPPTEDCDLYASCDYAAGRHVCGVRNHSELCSL